MSSKTTKRIETNKELDARLDKMKRLPRGSFKPKAGATDLKNIKVKVTMFIDSDVLNYFKTRAKDSNTVPYQIQINDELRRIMESETEGGLNKTARELLEDENFISELKKKLAA
jgi:uncharacterized protein (DUF4415 family)